VSASAPNNGRSQRSPWLSATGRGPSVTPWPATRKSARCNPPGWLKLADDDAVTGQRSVMLAW